MLKLISGSVIGLILMIFCVNITLAQSFQATSEASVAATQLSTPVPLPTAEPRIDVTQQNVQALEPLEALISQKELGSLTPFNAFDYAIANAVAAGVPANTIVLLLLLPLVAAVIAAARHLVGLRGFGIFLPAALSVVFLAIGPLVGIGLFLAIILTSTLIRITLRRLKVRLQYLPRMALLLWFVVLAVLGILFTAPYLSISGLTNVSIFPVLILVLLAEDFTKVQMGKNAKTAINLTTETLILALVSFIFLTFEPLQEFALLNPEILLIGIFIFDFIVGRYVGLRFMEYWRFRKLLSE